MKKVLIATVVAGVLVSGCATKTEKPSDTSVSKNLIDASLMQVANEIRDAQIVVANIGRTKPTAPDMGMIDDPALHLTVSITDWHGELEVILSDLADRVGYHFVRLGSKPAVGYIVQADYDNFPVNMVLRDLALQAGNGVQILVDGRQRKIALKYLKN